MNPDERYLDAEKAVAGAGFIDPNSIRLALDHCTPDDFGHPLLGRVYELMIGLRGAGLPLDEISVAQAANDRQYRNVTPLALHDLRAATPHAGAVAHYAQIVHEGGVRRRMVAAGTRIAQLAQGDGELTEALAYAQGEWQTVMGSGVQTHQTRTLREILDGVDEYDWAIPDLLERSDRLLITGTEGLGKSTLIRQIVILAAAGIHPLRFTPMEPLTVVVVDAENSERQWRRKSRGIAWKATHHGAADAVDRVHLCCVPRMDLTSDRDLGAVHAMIDEHEPALMAIGPLYKLVPRAITNDDDAAPLINALDSIRARGVALVMEAHAGHAKTGGGERDLRPRGSAALLGWPEFGYGLATDLDEDPGGSVVRMVRWRGDRDERAWPEWLSRGGEWPWMDHRPSDTWGRYEQQTATDPTEERY